MSKKRAAPADKKKPAPATKRAFAGVCSKFRRVLRTGAQVSDCGLDQELRRLFKVSVALFRTRLHRCSNRPRSDRDTRVLRTRKTKVSIPSAAGASRASSSSKKPSRTPESEEEEEEEAEAEAEDDDDESVVFVAPTKARAAIAKRASDASEAFKKRTIFSVFSEISVSCPVRCGRQRVV